MKASGNGTAQQCVANLMNIYQYEVPYARLMGMPPEIFDKPAEEAKVLAKNQASWLIENYEPRVTVNDINVTYNSEGRLIVQPDITVKE